MEIINHGDSGFVSRKKINDNFTELYNSTQVSALSELTDVELTDLADKDILVYNESTQLWENKNTINADNVDDSTSINKFVTEENINNFHIQNTDFKIELVGTQGIVYSNGTTDNTELSIESLAFTLDSSLVNGLLDTFDVELRSEDGLQNVTLVIIEGVINEPDIIADTNGTVIDFNSFANYKTVLLQQTRQVDTDYSLISFDISTINVVNGNLYTFLLLGDNFNGLILAKTTNSPSIIQQPWVLDLEIPAYQIITNITSGASLYFSISTSGSSNEGTKVECGEGKVSISGDVEITGNITSNINTITKEPTGFVNPELVIISYDSTNRTITLTGSVEAYFQGKKISALIDGWESDPHELGTNSFFLYYNGTTFVWSNTPWTFDMLQIALVYRDTANFCLRECHGLMQWQTHLELHNIIGTYLSAGGDLSNYVLSSTTVANRRPFISETSLYDEDLKTINPPLITASYTQFQLTSTNTANFVYDQSDIIALSVNQPYYNQFTGGNWVQTLLPVNAYAKIFVLAIPVTSDVECQKARYVFIQPQTQNTTLSTIQVISTANVNLGHIAGALSEFTFIAEIIIRYASNNWTLISVAKITGNKTSQVSINGNYLSVITTNPSLSGKGTTADPLDVAPVIIGSKTFSDGLTSDNYIGLKETNTPTSNLGIGKVYTKNDNKFYFQDGDGVEHMMLPDELLENYAFIGGANNRTDKILTSSILVGSAYLTNGVFTLPSTGITSNSIVTIGISTTGTLTGTLKFELSTNQCIFYSKDSSNNTITTDTVTFTYQIIL